MKVYKVDNNGNPVIYTDGKGFYLNAEQGLVPCDRYGNPLNQPMGGYQQPMGGYQQPMGGYQQPMGGYQQPMGGYQQPMGGYQQPMGGYQQPMGRYHQTMVNKPQPMGGYQQPMGGYQQPMGGYEPPNRGINPLSSGGGAAKSGVQNKINSGNTYKPLYNNTPAEEPITIIDNNNSNDSGNSSNEFLLDYENCPDLHNLNSIGIPLPPLVDEDKEAVIIKIENNNYSFIKVNKNKGV